MHMPAYHHNREVFQTKNPPSPTPVFLKLLSLLALNESQLYSAVLTLYYPRKKDGRCHHVTCHARDPGAHLRLLSRPEVGGRPPSSAPRQAEWLQRHRFSADVDVSGQKYQRKGDVRKKGNKKKKKKNSPYSAIKSVNAYSFLYLFIYISIGLGELLFQAYITELANIPVWILTAQNGGTVNF